MRDLEKDLEKWITDHDIGARGEWFYMTGEYIERAIKAEAEVERYKLMVKSITGGLDEAIETVHYLEAENALLHKVADAARKALNDAECPTQYDLDNDGYEDYYHECFDREGCPMCGIFKLGQALAELDKEGER